ncbi:unnamed protein product [Mycena citricolor]|uniref:S-methyl-5'-thioadenosine phosphorylase n=1 Tax=Mycena citricolor TaxID=2018698 RepID=A0AAD2K0Y2_9AGAR|nr:unnamed protein product [Mycena citricolor]
MTDKFSQLRSKWAGSSNAEALFFKASGMSPAMRLEVPELGREFTDGLYIGTDPAGTVFYDTADSFDIKDSDPVYYKAEQYYNEADSKWCAWVRFYRENVENPHAEFLAYDPQQTVTNTGIDKKSTCQGKWTLLKIGVATTTVRKLADESKITFTVDSVNLKAVIHTGSQSFNPKSVNYLSGLLYFKDMNTVKSGTCANYNNDRVVFYRNRNEIDFTAYFVPYLDPNLTLGSTDTKIFEDAILVGVIGGSGLYNLGNLTFIKHPWGFPSSPIAISSLPSGALVAFVARHGVDHSISPTDIPARANIAALKSLGVRTIVAFSAVGSLREEIAPGDFVLPSQLIDRTKGIRATSFFDGTGFVAHVGFSDPYSLKLSKWLEGAVAEALKEEGRGVKLWTGKTLVVMEGPQFSTRAESLMYRQWGGDLIGMTALPEAKLAREAEISFALIATSTDYDAWRPHEAGVTAAEVGKILQQNAETSRYVAAHVIERLLVAGAEDESLLSEEVGCMKFALMRSPAEFPHRGLGYVLPEYFKTH